MNKYASIIEKLQGRYSDQLLLGPTIGEAHLNKIESQLGHPLPQDYREFLRDYGGIGFDNAGFPFVQDGYPTEGSIFVFYGSGEEGTLANGYHQGILNFGVVNASPHELYPGIHLIRDDPDPIIDVTWPEELLPIAVDLGGNEICLALFGLRPGAILYWINAPSVGNQNLYLIADSFDEFMHLLRIYEL